MPGLNIVSDCSLDCWISQDSERTPDYSIALKSVAEGRQKALRLLQEGLFQHMIIYRWDYGGGEWDALEEFVPEPARAKPFRPPS
jgi:hypothetical protein